MESHRWVGCPRGRMPTIPHRHPLDGGDPCPGYPYRPRILRQGTSRCRFRENSADNGAVPASLIMVNCLGACKIVHLLRTVRFGEGSFFAFRVRDLPGKWSWVAF